MEAKQVLRVTAEEEKAIRNTFDRTEEEIREDIEALKDWAKKQPHLPQNTEDVILERMLQYNKFSLEKTKKKLDMFYAVRSLLPEFYDNCEPMRDEMQNMFKLFVCTPLPQLTDDLARVVVYKLLNGNVAVFEPYQFTKQGINTIHLRMRYDICVYEHYVFDISMYTMGHVAKITPVYVKQLYNVVEKAYSDRIRGVHFVNVPSIAATLISLVKSVLKEKIANRIYVHKDLDSLHQVIPKRILPSDFGGLEKSSLELHNDFVKFCEANNEWIVQQNLMKSNEHLRPGKPLDSGMFGIEGSFRRLNLD